MDEDKFITWLQAIIVVLIISVLATVMIKSFHSAPESWWFNN